MNTIKYIFILICLFVQMGCFDDNGNYDYNQVYKIDIKLPNTVTMVVAESHSFKPELSFDEEQPSDVNYEWQVEGEVVSTDSVYTHTAKELGELRCLLTVSDKRTGAKFYKAFSINVKPLYEMGFLLLTENGDNSDLGFVRAVRTLGNSQTNSNDTIMFVGDYKNCYSELYGEPIKGKPESLREHFANDAYNIVYGEVTVKTNLGEKCQFIELNGQSLKKETHIEEEFVGGVLPDTFHPIDLLHTCFDSFLLDENGLLYTRRCDPATGYHLGHFSKDIVYLGGERSFSNIIYGDYVESSAIYAVEKDIQTGKKNYLGIYSDDYSPRRNLTELKLDYYESRFARHFTDFTEEIVAADYFSSGEDDCAGNAVVLKNEAGEYFLHLFVGGGYGSVLNIISSQKINLTKRYGITDFVKLGTFRNCNMIYIADKHNIYYFDYDDYDSVHDFGVVETFDKEIVAIATQSMLSYGKNSYEHHIGVAFADGYFDIYEMQYDKKDADCWHKFSSKVYSSSQSFGKIHDVIWKLGIGNLYFNGR